MCIIWPPFCSYLAERVRVLVTANCRWRNHVGFVHLPKSQRTHYTRVQAARRLRARISAYGNNPFIKMQLRMHVTQKMSLLSPARARSPAAPPPLIRRVARFENSLKKILINSLLFAALSLFSSFFTRPRAPHSNPHNIALVFFLSLFFKAAERICFFVVGSECGSEKE